MIKKYSLNEKSKILDIGCGKGFLIYELQKLTKSSEIYGCDNSPYAIKNAKPNWGKRLGKHRGADLGTANTASLTF